MIRDNMWDMKIVVDVMVETNNMGSEEDIDALSDGSFEGDEIAKEG